MTPAEKATTKPLLSACVPTFNRAKYLRRCLESLASQEYDNKEVVVCDNASEDDTEDVVREFRERHPDLTVKYFRQTHNLGMVRNWRTCLEMASGDYFGIFDDDNYLTSNDYFSKVAELISKCPDISLVTTDFVISYGRKEILNSINLPEISEGRDAYVKYYRHDIGRFFFCFYRRDLAIQLDIFKEDIITFDVQAFLMFLLNGKLGVIKSINGSQTKHDSNVKARLIDAVLFQDRVFDTPSVYQISTEERRRPLRRATRHTLWKSLYLPCVGNVKHYATILSFSVKRYGLLFTLGNAVFSICYLPCALLRRIRLGSLWVR